VCVCFAPLPLSAAAGRQFIHRSEKLDCQFRFLHFLLPLLLHFPLPSIDSLVCRAAAFLFLQMRIYSVYSIRIERLPKSRCATGRPACIDFPQHGGCDECRRENGAHGTFPKGFLPFSQILSSRHFRRNSRTRPEFPCFSPLGRHQFSFTPRARESLAACVIIFKSFRTPISSTITNNATRESSASKSGRGGTEVNLIF
jgi:hypothetical protein